MSTHSEHSPMDGRAIAALRARKVIQPHMAPPPERLAQYRAIRRRHSSIGNESQAQRMLEALALGPITPPEAREWLLVSNPPNTVMRLRRRGVTIYTTDTTWVDADGNPRRTVTYELGHD